MYSTQKLNYNATLSNIKIYTLKNQTYTVHEQYI